MFGVRQRFGQREHVAGDQNLIDHLAVLPAARPPQVRDVLAHLLEQRQNFVVRVHIAAHHDGQLRAFRPDLPAGHRRVQRRRAFFGRGRGNFFCQ